MVERKEAAADIMVSVEDEDNIVVDSISLTKEIDIETIYGSGRTLPDAYSVNQISYQGSMELMGNKLELEELFFDSNGIPKEATVTIVHFNEDITTYSPVLCTNEGYEMSSGDTTTTSFEFVAFGKETDNNVDTEPTQW